MALLLDMNLSDKEQLCSIGKALSSPVRLEILDLLNYNSLNIGQIAQALDLPASSTALHVKILERAGLLVLESRPGSHGSMKLCRKNAEGLRVSFLKPNENIDHIVTTEMPVGHFTKCSVTPTCGLANEQGFIGINDMPANFYLPHRTTAGMLWSSSGYVEYRFPNLLPPKKQVKKLILSFEICSEAPGYNPQWKSDISLQINDCFCGIYRSPGDFGARRGKLTPLSMPDGYSQYGLLVTFEISKDGTFLNGQPVSETKIEDLFSQQDESIKVRIGNQPDAEYVGGFVLFGKEFGDFPQDLLLSLIY